MVNGPERPRDGIGGIGGALILSVKFPLQVSLTDEEAREIARLRLALELHKLPQEIDQMPYTDACKLLDLMRADQVLGRVKL